MSIDTQNSEIEKIKQELAKYKAGDESTTEDLLQSMKKISSWLTEQLQK